MTNEERIEKAVALFKSGFNCSQAVVAAFSDLYNIDESLALRMASSFGGGIGRMRQTCGAACGMFLLAGLENGSSDALDINAKANNYKLVQELANEFKKQNGSIICAELLGLKKEAPTSTTPETRTENYYKKRPCAMMVETAARIFVDKVVNVYKTE